MHIGSVQASGRSTDFIEYQSAAHVVASVANSIYKRWPILLWAESNNGQTEAYVVINSPVVL